MRANLGGAPGAHNARWRVREAPRASVRVRQRKRIGMRASVFARRHARIGIRANEYPQMHLSVLAVQCAVALHCNRLRRAPRYGS